MGNNRRQVEDVHLLLALHEESYKHLHHLQNLRATYFNFYLVVVTAGVAGLVGVASAFGEVGWQNLVILGFVLWATSLFMLARAERLAGLVTHELVMLRRIRSHLRDKYPILSGIQSAAQSPIDGVEFWRPVWSRDKNVESLICILISIAGIAVFSAALPVATWAQWMFAAAGGMFILWTWTAEIGHLQERHSACCLRIVVRFCRECKALTSHSPIPSRGWKPHLLGRTLSWECSNCTARKATGGAE